MSVRYPHLPVNHPHPHPSSLRPFRRARAAAAPPPADGAAAEEDQGPLGLHPSSERDQAPPARMGGGRRLYPPDIFFLGWKEGWLARGGVAFWAGLFFGSGLWHAIKQRDVRVMIRFAVLRSL